VDRVRGVLADVEDVKEKKVFGSVAFLVNGKLCLSARESRIMCKVDPVLQPDLTARTGVRPMVMWGRELKGYVHGDKRVLKTNSDLRFWVNLALDMAATNEGKNMKVRN
jgi:TfoX/Sxy family transcriptional regulator of competence genes